MQDRLRAAQPCLWTNPGRQAEVPSRLSVGTGSVGVEDMQAAVARFGRFTPLLAELFPQELQASGGVIESPLVPAPALGQALGLGAADGALGVKCDHLLPVAGSIKARGGIHEVLEFAETLALEHGLVAPGSDYRALAQPERAGQCGRGHEGRFDHAAARLQLREQFGQQPREAAKACHGRLHVVHAHKGRTHRQLRWHLGHAAGIGPQAGLGGAQPILHGRKRSGCGGVGHKRYVFDSV